MDIFWGLGPVCFRMPLELYSSVSFVLWFTKFVSLASPFIYTPTSYWQNYSPRLTRRVLTLKICRVSEDGVILPDKTYRSYEKHDFINFYCSPFERCSVCFKRNISVTGHKSELFCAATDKIKAVLVIRQLCAISRSALTFLTLSDSSRAENSVLLGHFDPSSCCHCVTSKRRSRITHWRGVISQKNRILS